MKFIVLSGVAGALSWLFYFLALQSANVTQIVPIDRMSAVFALVLAVVILGEKVTLQVIAGSILMVIGAIPVAMGLIFFFSPRCQVDSCAPSRRSRMDNVRKADSPPRGRVMQS